MLNRYAGFRTPDSTFFLSLLQAHTVSSVTMLRSHWSCGHKDEKTGQMISCLHEFSILYPVQPCCGSHLGGVLPAEMIDTPTPAPLMPWKGFWTEDSCYILEVFVLRLNELHCVFRLCGTDLPEIFYFPWDTAVMDPEAATWLFQSAMVHSKQLWETDTWLWPWRWFLPHRWFKVVSSISYKMACSSPIFHVYPHHTFHATLYSILYINSPAFWIRASVDNFPRYYLS